MVEIEYITNVGMGMYVHLIFGIDGLCGRVCVFHFFVVFSLFWGIVVPSLTWPIHLHSFLSLSLSFFQQFPFKFKAFQLPGKVHKFYIYVSFCTHIWHTKWGVILSGCLRFCFGFFWANNTHNTENHITTYMAMMARPFTYPTWLSFPCHIVFQFVGYWMILWIGFSNFCSTFFRIFYEFTSNFLPPQKTESNQKFIVWS